MVDKKFHKYSFKININHLSCLYRLSSKLVMHLFKINTELYFDLFSIILFPVINCSDQRSTSNFSKKQVLKVK